MDDPVNAGGRSDERGTDLEEAVTERIVRVLGPCIVSEHTRGPSRPGPTDGAITFDVLDPIATSLIELTAIQKKIVARLAIARPGSVAPELLIEAVWGSTPPATARTAIQNQISRLRSGLGRDAIITDDGHYQLTLPTDAEIVSSFLRSLGSVDESVSTRAGPDLVEEIDRVLEFWRGVPYIDLDEPSEVDHERLRLAEVRRSLETVQLERAIDSGQLAWAVPEAERLVAETPGDEHRWTLLVRALERSGRRGDALGAFERARRVLVSTLGLEPSEELLDAEAEALAGPRTSGSTGLVRLVGRDDVVDRILDAAGDGRPVVIRGETGVGKSRVLAEVQRRLSRSGFRLASHDCPLYPATAVSTLRDVVSELGTDMAAGSPPIPAFVDAVAAARDGGSVAIVIDDVDRAGPTTMQALCEVTTLEGVAFVAAADDVSGSDLGHCAEIIELGPFDRSLSADYVSAVVGRDAGVDPEHVEWLYLMSGGNPGLLEHLMGGTSIGSERGSVVAPPLIGTPGTGPPTVGVPDDPTLGSSFRGPPGLLETVRERLAGLDPMTRAALDIAAVCGPRCRTWLLAAFGVEEGMANAVETSLLDVVLLSEDGSAPGPDDGSQAGEWVQFRHGIVREVLYDDLAAGHRMEIHYRAAELLRSSGAPPSAIATHSLRAHDLDLELACRDCMAAAAHSASDGAHADAVEWLERALKVIERDHADCGDASDAVARLRVELMVRLADEMRLAGMPNQEEMQFAAADAAFALGDSDLIARAAFAALQLGATTESGTAHERATKLAEDALAVVTDKDDRALIAGSASLAHSMSGQAELCRDLFLDAIDWAERPSTRCLILPFTYLSLGHPRDLDQRESLTEELLSLSRAENDHVGQFEALQLEYSVGLMRSDGDRVRRSIAASSELIDRVRDIGRLWSLRYQLASLAHIDGELERAERLAEESLAIFDSVSPSRAFAAYGGQLLVIRMAQGRIAELADTIEGLLAEQPGVAAWNAALALALTEEDPERAARLASTALDGVEEDFTWVAAHMIGGRAAAKVGDDVTRRLYLERLSPWSGLGSWQGTCSYGPIDTVLWMLHDALGDDDSADHHLRVARGSAERLASPTFGAELVD